MEKLLWEFLDKVQELRKTQKKYFRTRDINVLQESKDLEKQVDKLIEDLQSKREGELF